MPYTTNAKNQMLNSLRGVNPTVQIAYCSLHTANPGESGANEVVGGSYARQAVTFLAASGGVITKDASDPVFNVPTSTTITHVGFWSAVSGGTFLAYADVTDEVFASAGTYTVHTASLDLNA